MLIRIPSDIHFVVGLFTSFSIYRGFGLFLLINLEHIVVFVTSDFPAIYMK